LRFAFAGMRPVWSRFLGAGSLFRPALFTSVGAWNPRNHRKHCNHRHRHASPFQSGRCTHIAPLSSIANGPLDSQHPRRRAAVSQPLFFSCDSVTIRFRTPCFSDS
jgi:hypothetical protein